MQLGILCKNVGDRRVLCPFPLLYKVDKRQLLFFRSSHLTFINSADRWRSSHANRHGTAAVHIVHPEWRARRGATRRTHWHWRSRHSRTNTRWRPVGRLHAGNSPLSCCMVTRYAWRWPWGYTRRHWDSVEICRRIVRFGIWPQFHLDGHTRLDSVCPKFREDMVPICGVLEVEVAHGDVWADP